MVLAGMLGVQCHLVIQYRETNMSMISFKATNEWVSPTLPEADAYLIQTQGTILLREESSEPTDGIGYTLANDSINYTPSTETLYIRAATPTDVVIATLTKGE